ncbi:MAG: helix-turn-helix transcriptional regulator, partial [Treponema sp.]|nr:helix-turn-helix transcriptional regulator [Treponema sp.]
KTGLSMHQYLIRTRIRNAHTMLLTGEYKVAETAELCGYTDICHFHKQFKRIIDIPPSQCIPKC